MNCFFQKANFLVKVTLGIWGKVFWMIHWWTSAVKLSEVVFCQFVSQKTSYPGGALDGLPLFICNTDLCYYYCYELLLVVLVSSCKLFLWAGAQLLVLLWVSSGSKGAGWCWTPAACAPSGYHWHHHGYKVTIFFKTVGLILPSRRCQNRSTLQPESWIWSAESKCRWGSKSFSRLPWHSMKPDYG